jgi:hypothetical protein
MLRAPEAHGTNQSPSPKPTEPKNAEQSAGDRSRLRNDRATDLDIIDYGLTVVAIGRPTGEYQSDDQSWRAIGARRDSDTG